MGKEQIGQLPRAFIQQPRAKVIVTVVKERDGLVIHIHCQRHAELILGESHSATGQDPGLPPAQCGPDRSIAVQAEYPGIQQWLRADARADMERQAGTAGVLI